MGHPWVDDIDVFAFVRGYQLVGLGIFFPRPQFFLSEVQMILQERVVTKMMLLWIKDWDTFQRVMHLWRRGEI
jgi:hypothetical protein